MSGPADERGRGDKPAVPPSSPSPSSPSPSSMSPSWGSRTGSGATRPRGEQAPAVPAATDSTGTDSAAIEGPATGPLHEDDVTQIRAARLAHKAIFFRDQHLDHAAHLAFARRFDEPTHRPGTKHGVHPPGYPMILTIAPEADDARYGRDFEEEYRLKWTNYSAGWHTDLTPPVNPPAASILRAETVPAFGGDTQWTNLVAAYEGMSPPLRDLADGLRAEHAFFAGCQLSEARPPRRRDPGHGPGRPTSSTGGGSMSVSLHRRMISCFRARQSLNRPAALRLKKSGIRKLR